GPVPALHGAAGHILEPAVETVRREIREGFALHALREIPGRDEVVREFGGERLSDGTAQRLERQRAREQARAVDLAVVVVRETRPAGESGRDEEVAATPAGETTRGLPAGGLRKREAGMGIERRGMQRSGARLGVVRRCHEGPLTLQKRF